MSNDDNKTDKENASFKAEKINENSSNLVIYFSRTGHSKKIAYQVALEEKAKIYEIKSRWKNRWRFTLLVVWKICDA